MRKIDRVLFTVIDADTENEDYFFDNKINMLKQLVKHGANVNAKDEYELRPIHYAADCGDVEVAKFLTNNGAYVPVDNTVRYEEVVEFLRTNNIKFEEKSLDQIEKYSEQQ